MVQASQQKQVKELKINTSPELLKGLYANTARVVVSDNETIIDFAFVVRDQTEPLGQMVCRVIIPPSLTQKLADSIVQTLEAHKKKKQPK